MNLKHFFASSIFELGNFHLVRQTQKHLSPQPLRAGPGRSSNSHISLSNPVDSFTITTCFSPLNPLGSCFNHPHRKSDWVPTQVMASSRSRRASRVALISHLGDYRLPL